MRLIKPFLDKDKPKDKRSRRAGAQRERYVVRACTGNPDGPKAALTSYFVFLSDHDHAVIVAPEMRDLQNAMVTPIIGAALATQLVEEGEVSIGRHKTVSLCTPDTLHDHADGDLYLALWGNDATMSAIEALKPWRTAIFLTEAAGASDAWEARHRVYVLYDDGRHVPVERHNVIRRDESARYL